MRELLGKSRHNRQSEARGDWWRSETILSAKDTKGDISELPLYEITARYCIGES